MILKRSLSLNVLLYLHLLWNAEKTLLYLEGGLYFPQHPTLHSSVLTSAQLST